MNEKVQAGVLSAILLGGIVLVPAERVRAARTSPWQQQRSILTVARLLRLCRTHPKQTMTVRVRGYFVPAVYPPDVIPPAGQEQGRLFASASASRDRGPSLRVAVGPVPLARYHEAIPRGPVRVRGEVSCAQRLLIADAYHVIAPPQAPVVGQQPADYWSW